MKKNKFTKELVHKDTIGRYDVVFTYKNKIRLTFMLPEEEKCFTDELMEDDTVRVVMKLFNIFRTLFGKAIFGYFCRTKDISWLLEGKGGVIHNGDVILENVEN